MRIFPEVALACVLALQAAVAGEPSPVPRPVQPLMLSDFESPEAVAAWTGLPCTREEALVSSGAHGMQFAIAKWNKGEEQRPGVRLTYDEGKGFPIEDWSAYGAVAVDAWVLGDQPGHLGLKVIDADGISSWTTHVDIQPGKMREVQLLIDDAAADCDIHHVAQVVLYALRPGASYTLVVDNLRLLPREKPPLALFQLQYPNYRGLIFPGADTVEVRAQMEAGEYGLRPGELSTVLTLQAGIQRRTRKSPLKGPSSTLTVACGNLPEGPVTLTASLVRTGARGALAQRSWDLRKIGGSDVKKLTTYVNRDNNLVVDGKPFFPLGWYTNTSLDYLNEVADSPFNCLLPYGTNHVARADMVKYLDAMQARGLKLIYCLNDVYPTSTLFEGKDWEGIEGNDAIAAAVVKAYRDHPAILAWYLNDERPKELAPELEDYYRRVRSADPAHPCFIVLCNKKDFYYLRNTTDILGGDTYPIPHDPVTFVSAMTDTAREAGHDSKPVWMVPQAFGWYQYNSEDKDRGHTPSAKELETGRAPTFEEDRCMTYLALTHGAKGLIYYCYYDLRVLPQYPEMWAWMKKIGNEVKTLSPVLLSSQDLGPAPFEPATAPIHTKLKICDGRLYLMSVNAGREACEVTFDLKRPLPPSVQVMFEDRDASTKDTTLTDGFKPLDVHVYDLGPVLR